jgi:creatinine amidohydrolase/Fe(II)-dependent formamide hydrolase-like protein
VHLEKAHDDPVTDLMMLGTALLPLRLWWSSFSKEGIYGNVVGSSEAKGKKLVAAAVEGLANIFVDFYNKQIPPRVDHH